MKKREERQENKTKVKFWRKRKNRKNICYKGRRRQKEEKEKQKRERKWRKKTNWRARKICATLRMCPFAHQRDVFAMTNHLMCARHSWLRRSVGKGLLRIVTGRTSGFRCILAPSPPWYCCCHSAHKVHVSHLHVPCVCRRIRCCRPFLCSATSSCFLHSCIVIPDDIFRWYIVAVVPVNKICLWANEGITWFQTTLLKIIQTQFLHQR